jgi:hypothetical protein
MSAPGQFSIQVSGLTPGMTYEFKAIAASTLIGGQSTEGNYETFSTTPSIPEAPLVVSTGSASDITSSSAVLQGYLSDIGPYDKVTIWFSWGNSPNVANSSSNQVIYGPGPFSILISGLNPNTTYYFRASAKPQVIGVATVSGSVNSFNTTGGESLSVSTGAESQVNATSATITGYLDSMGGYSNANVWFEWGKTRSYGQTTAFQMMYSPGAYNFTLQGLSPGITYHFRALAVPSVAGGVTVHGVDSIFTTSSAPSIQVATSAPSNISTNSATFNGLLTSAGTGGNVYVWFEYGTDTSLGNTTPQQMLNTPAAFKYTVPNLVSGVTYYYRSAAFFNGSNVYGQYTSFSMGSKSPVAISTNSASSVSTNAATMNGYLNSLGTLKSVQVWFNWGNNPNYGKITEYQTITSPTYVSEQIGGLTPGVDYYFQAVAQAPDGSKTYGEQSVFTTTANNNVGVTALPATSITSSTAVLNGNLGNIGTSPGIQVWFEYGTTAQYGNSTEMQLKNSPGDFSAAITGLAPGKNYYYRAVALSPTGGSKSINSPASSFLTSGSPGPGPSPTPSSTSEIPMFVWLIGAGFVIVIVVLLTLLISRR